MPLRDSRYETHRVEVATNDGKRNDHEGAGDNGIGNVSDRCRAAVAVVVGYREAEKAEHKAGCNATDRANEAAMIPLGSEPIWSVN